MDQAFTSANPAELVALNRSFMTVRYDADGKIVAANNRLLRRLGYTLEALLGQDFSMFVSKSEDRSEHADLWAALKAGKAREDTTLYITATGDEVWLRSQIMPLTDEKGAIVEIVQIAEDVTKTLIERADATSQLAAIREAYLTAQFSPDGALLEANAPFRRAFGYDGDGVTGLSHDDLMDAEQRRGEALTLWGSLVAGERFTGEVRRSRSDGADVWLQCVYSPVLDAAERIRKIALYAADVTEERTRQADYESQVKAIRKSSSVVTYDMHGTILNANDLFLDAMGYTKGEITGRHHHIFMAPTDVHGTDYATFWNGLRKGEYRTGQYKRFGKDGREVWLQASYNPIFDARGEPVRVVEYAQAVTDERMVQAEHQGQIAAIHDAQCVLSCDLSGKVLDANENFLNLMGYRYAEVRGHDQRLFIPDDVADCSDYRSLWEGLAEGNSATGEYKHVTKTGEEVWLQCAYNPILDLNNRPVKIMMYASDVTSEKLTAADHTAQIEAIERTQCVVIFDMDATLVDANQNFLDAVKYDKSELIGLHHSSLVDRDYAGSRSYVKMWDTLRAGEALNEMCKRVAKDGTEVWFQASYSPICDLNGDPVRVIKYATDVTANVGLAEAFEDAKRQAHHDPATSLPNRAKLASFMNQHLQDAGAKLAVFYIDIDRFKTINDTCGHHVGDRVLGEVADRLRRTIREDQMVARIGGDEFVIVAPDLPMERMERLCTQLYEAMAEPVRHDGGEVVVGMSIGIALSPGDGTSPDELLRAADAALYRAKGDGRGCYRLFDSAMNERIAAQRKLIEDMRDGLVANDFYLDFQPRYDAATKRIKSAEALVRWHHPERGRVGPDEFVPLAEQSGQIIPLGKWVLSSACRVAAGWSDTGVSVNVSPVQFRDPGFLESVRDVLAETGLSADRLEIELTEGVLVDDAASAIATLAALKTMGVKLAMDDFGTGYSSLSYLRNFPFDVIKIDRSFIGDLADADGARPIIQAVIALARALGMSVTAEGVETDQQLSILAEDECDEIQGFLLSKPVTPNEIETMVAAERRAA